MKLVGGGARHILVVEDDRELREWVAQTLVQEGYDVSTARNGAEALERLVRVPADLVLLDLMMPVMSGWEFRERQKRDPRLAAIPVVVMTATPSLEAAAIDAADLLLKPLRLKELLATVVRQLGHPFAEHELLDAPSTDPSVPYFLLDEGSGRQRN